MELDVLTIVKGFAVAIGTATPAIGQGYIGGKAMEAIGRNPEAVGKILPILLIAAALTETSSIYTLVIILTLG